MSDWKIEFYNAFYRHIDNANSFSRMLSFIRSLLDEKNERIEELEKDKENFGYGIDHAEDEIKLRELEITALKARIGELERKIFDIMALF